MKFPQINTKLTPPPVRNDADAAKRIAGVIVGSMISLWPLCSKHAIRTSRKLATNSSPKKVMSTIRHKAIRFRQKKRVGDGETDSSKTVIGDGGSVWRKTILMGIKCQPLDFTGVIYYDSDGNRLSEAPMRSPRESPLPSYAYKSEREPSRLGF